MFNFFFFLSFTVDVSFIVNEHGLQMTLAFEQNSLEHTHLALLCDLDLDPITLVLKQDLDIRKMYV